MRTALLVKECQVPKQELNRVLYRMQKESMVYLTASQRSPQDPAAASESTGPPLSSLQDRIYRFLKANGPCKALHIAKGLGMRTAKDVNPDLYKMGSSHLLSCDEKSKEWRVSGAEDSGRRNREIQSATIIYQQNPINMISQSQISIVNSEATQTGHGNVIVRCGEKGAVTPLHVPPVAPGDGWGPQSIYMERSMLWRVQMGHSNEMNLLCVPTEGPACRPSGSPPDASFEAQMPEPGLHPKGDMVQKIHIKSCHVEDAVIGNSNKMTLIPGTAGHSGAAGPSDDGGREPEPQQQQNDAACGAQLGHDLHGEIRTP